MATTRKWWQILLDPLGFLNPKQADENSVNILNGSDFTSADGEPAVDWSNVWSKIVSGVTSVWNDLTGKSQIERQNELDRMMAEEEYQRNLQSIGDTAAAYEAAGFNRNILYGGSSGSPVQYSAPQLQAYSGSKTLDTILNKVGFVTKFIPALYQATAGLEAIDQAREKTKQSEIRTMAMGLDMLDKGYRLGEKNFSLPFVFQLNRPGRNWEDRTDFIKFMPWTNDEFSFRKYADSALKHQFDILESVGLSNQLNRTRSSYLGYQDDLNRRFGTAGKIAGLIGSGVGSAVSAFTGFGRGLSLLGNAKKYKYLYRR